MAKNARNRREGKEEFLFKILSGIAIFSYVALAEMLYKAGVGKRDITFFERRHNMSGEGMSHEIPSEITDEDRWLNLFSTKPFAVPGAGGVFTLGLYKLFGLFSLPLAGGIPGLLLTVFAVGITMIPKMGDDYMTGAGQKQKSGR